MLEVCDGTDTYRNVLLAGASEQALGAVTASSLSVTGRVGVGTAAPAGGNRLHVKSGGFDVMRLENSQPSGGAWHIGVGDSGLGIAGTFSLGHVGNPGGVGGGTHHSRLAITNGGSVGIGTTKPVDGAQLDVQGAIVAHSLSVTNGVRVGAVDATCTTSIVGTLRWSGQLQVCNDDEEWRAVYEPPVPTSCASLANGVHSIDFDGDGSMEPMEVACQGGCPSRLCRKHFFRVERAALHSYGPGLSFLRSAPQFYDRGRLLRAPYQ